MMFLFQTNLISPNMPTNIAMIKVWKGGYVGSETPVFWSSTITKAQYYDSKGEHREGIILERKGKMIAIQVNDKPGHKKYIEEASLIKTETVQTGTLDFPMYSKDGKIEKRSKTAYDGLTCLNHYYEGHLYLEFRGIKFSYKDENGEKKSVNVEGTLEKINPDPSKNGYFFTLVAKNGDRFNINYTTTSTTKPMVTYQPKDGKIRQFTHELTFDDMNAFVRLSYNDGSESKPELVAYKEEKWAEMFGISNFAYRTSKLIGDNDLKRLVIEKNQQYGEFTVEQLLNLEIVRSTRKAYETNKKTGDYEEIDVQSYLVTALGPGKESIQLDWQDWYNIYTNLSKQIKQNFTIYPEGMEIEVHAGGKKIEKVGCYVNIREEQNGDRMYSVIAPSYYVKELNQWLTSSAVTPVTVEK